MSHQNSTQKNWTSWHHRLHKKILSNKTLIPKGANILIAVSGGQDSMALLNLINDLKKQHNWSIYVWHGDHQWHEESSQYANELKKYCENLNIQFYSDKPTKENIFSEEQARDWRYAKLRYRAKTILGKQQQNNIYVLTGHTSTDNAETFILNLARGSNYAGLSNIDIKRLLENQIFLIRPFLIFNREETKKFCDRMKIPIWEDPTNSDIKIKRNFVRQKIIPALESLYPGCSERINDFSQKMKSFNAERDDLSNLAYQLCKNKFGLKREILNGMCVEARCTILNKFTREICAKQLSSKTLSNLASAILDKNKGQIDLPEDLQIIWNKNYINYKKT